MPEEVVPTENERPRRLDSDPVATTERALSIIRHHTVGFHTISAHLNPSIDTMIERLLAEQRRDTPMDQDQRDALFDELISELQAMRLSILRLFGRIQLKREDGEG